MPDPLAAIDLRRTPQSQAADPRQVPNSAGGHTFTVAPLERLRRFLVLGVEGGTYYVGERELTQDNAGVVLDWTRHRTVELVDEVVTLSTTGRAPRNATALFALAAAASLGDLEGRRAALAALPVHESPRFDTDFFPEGVNVEVATPLEAGRVSMRVHERGAGETQSCGTGIVATAVAALAGWISFGEVLSLVDLLGVALMGSALVLAKVTPRGARAAP